MAKTYSQELRGRVFGVSGREMKTQQIAEVFQVSKACARRVAQVPRETGRTTPLPRGGASLVTIDPERLRELVATHLDVTSADRRNYVRSWGYGK